MSAAVAALRAAPARGGRSIIGSSAQGDRRGCRRWRTRCGCTAATWATCAPRCGRCATAWRTLWRALPMRPPLPASASGACWTQSSRRSWMIGSTSRCAAAGCGAAPAGMHERSVFPALCSSLGPPGPICWTVSRVSLVACVGLCVSLSVSLSASPSVSPSVSLCVGVCRVSAVPVLGARCHSRTNMCLMGRLAFCAIQKHFYSRPAPCMQSTELLVGSPPGSMYS